MRILVQLSLVLALLLSMTTASWGDVLWTDDFSADPAANWTTDGSTFSWNSGAQRVEMNANYNNSGAMRRATGTTLTEGGGFQFQVDMQPDYTYWSCSSVAGLTNSAGNGKVEVVLAPEMAEWATWLNITLKVQDADGGTYESSAITVNKYDWHNYGMTVDYTAVDQTFTLTMIDKNDGNAVEGIRTATLDSGKTISLDQFRLGSDGSGHAVTFFDNVAVSAVPEPATMGLLAIGGISMLLRRKR